MHIFTPSPSNHLTLFVNMGKSVVSLASLSLIIIFCMMFLPFLSYAISQCNGPCQAFDDCDGQLICINGKCNDDPDVSNICTGGGGGFSPSLENDCQPSGSLTCGQNSYPTYSCSPPVISPTNAKLTLNDFSEGGDGGARSKCDEEFHSNSELVVALSTGWYNGGSRCGQMINIAATSNGNSVMAKVVDECDSMNGCDEEHANQEPCGNNIVDGSAAVWESLELNTESGEEEVTWSMA